MDIKYHMIDDAKDWSGTQVFLLLVYSCMIEYNIL